MHHINKTTCISDARMRTTGNYKIFMYAKQRKNKTIAASNAAWRHIQLQQQHQQQQLYRFRDRKSVLSVQCLEGSEAVEMAAGQCLLNVPTPNSQWRSGYFQRGPAKLHCHPLFL